jgi:tRNA-splicing ligase RtcB (3'-phosphate/5'-hydroxy nucleic acid ligase)
MITIKNKLGIVTKIFAKTFEEEAYKQIKNLVEFEAYENSKVRIMPDAHAGKGCTVGTTICITDKITPNLVGVDIGCGMLTIKLKNKELDFEKIDKIINQNVPHGFNTHENPIEDFDFSNLRCAKHVDLKRAMTSIGSLGGGNHFIEIAKSENDGAYYLIIHTGSRKLGGDVCKYYQDKAVNNTGEIKKLIKDTIDKLKSEGRESEIAAQLKLIKRPETDKDLAYLTGSDFEDYMNDMNIVQKFASLNRVTIANIILRTAELESLDAIETIHNYIDFNRKILRKGAVSAEKNELLLIPINMRDGSLLCRGKGNSDWNYSAPHGAGRLMSRNKAKELLKLDEFKQEMDGIYTSSVNENTLDEAPGAYKSMNEIVEAVGDTVEIIDTLKPVYNFKSH